jgi:hypothetical protein
MNKKKWLYVLIIVVLSLLILFLYNAFNGNPITKQLSKSEIKNYLAETYPNDQFSIGKPFYNFKDGGYHYDVRIIGDANQMEYDITVTGILGSTIYFDGIYYANQDKKLIEKLQNEANAELKLLLKDKIPEILDVSTGLQILKGKYDATISWDKNFIPEKPMTLFLTIDSSELSTEDIAKLASNIQEILNREQYVYSNITINGNILSNNDGKDGVPFWNLKYYLSYESDTVLRSKDVKIYK